jgi:putative GTP pyrophosphokinase
VSQMSLPLGSEVGPTKSAVKRAGETLRTVQLGGVVSAADYSTAYLTLIGYRAAHQYPLIKATNVLRHMVRAENCDVEVSQRLKRIPTILDKLRREPEMDLSRMQDFGGCRAVLKNIDEVRRVQTRVSRAHRRRTGREPHVKDYITTPRDTGYRGVHVIVTYDGRLVEVQLRTKVMHEWAITVERLAGRTGLNLKSDEGPPELQEFFAHVSLLMAIDEAGETADPDMLSRMTTLRDTALQFLNGENRSWEGR